MKTCPLGTTGVEVSAICLGTAGLGTNIDKDTSFRLLDQYYEGGGRFLDTANGYASWVEGASGGESETTIGDWMKARGNRPDMFIATKVGIGYKGVKNGLSSDQIFDECQKSLSRLGIETIDLYYAHMDDRVTPLEETLVAFDRVVVEGKVRFIGASNYRTWRLEEARWTSHTLGLASFCCTQNHYTYLIPRPGADFSYMHRANEGLFDYCTQRNITVLAYFSLLWGSYSREDKPLWENYEGRHSVDRMTVLKSFAEDIGATPHQVVLAWMLQSNPPVIPVVGASKPEQIIENLSALELHLSDEQMEGLNRA
jgi:aryl-alcohol dehydrogenase-like predicted oxidoreductase